jgi:glycosyltransferase involved in cell wall biosynthesis
VVIFFFAIGAKDRASSRLRVWDHLSWFERQGASVIADSFTPVAANASKAGIAARALRRLPRWIAAFFRSDAVVIQESLLLWPLLYMRNLGKRRRVVFDFSDPVDRHGTGLKGAVRRFAFAHMVRRADATMVENRSYLTALQPQAVRVAHFYGPVDARRYGEALARQAPQKAAVRPDLRIGWTGSPGTYRFIAPLMPVIDEIAKDHPIEMVLIGVTAIDHEFRHARLSLVPWQEDTEFEIVPTFNLGLFRLEPTPDALWRGAGKLFIYMAAGVPFVASDLGIAHGVMEEFGVGYPVPADSDWEQVLRKAVADEAGRNRMAAESVGYARDHLSYDAHRRLLTSLLEQRDTAIK